MMHVRSLHLVALLGSCALIANAAAEGGNARPAYRQLGHRGPTVVLEAGQGLGMRSWDKVAPRLARCARVVVYDRAGIAASPPRADASAVKADQVADALAELLRVVHAPPPYILVGHSLGGLYVQSFARRHPREVAAVVLVDAASPLEPPGVFVSTTPFPPGSIAAAEEAGVAPSQADLIAGPPLPAVPLIVLAATDHGDTPEREALWLQVQARTAALSPKGRLEVVEGSGHFIQDDRPDAVVDAVREAARSAGLPLAGCDAARPRH